MSEKLEKIIEQLKSLSLLEAVELVAEIEKVFQIDASGPVPTFGTGNAISTVVGTPVVEKAEEEEKTSFEITLTEVPADKKIAILKVVRAITGLGLKESKDIVDNVPKLVKEGVNKEEAEKIKKELEEAGGKALIK